MALTSDSDATVPPNKKSRRVGCIALGVIALVIFAIIGALGGDPDDELAADATATPESRSGVPTIAPETSTTEPSVTPSTPAPSPLPTLEPEPAFATIELSGTGSAVPRFEIPSDAVAIAEVTHAGGGNFAVWTVDETGDQTDLLVNEIGNYTGTVLFDETTGSHSVAFDVEASGAWTITIKPLSEAFRWDGTETLVGNGDDVAILDPASSGFKSVTLTHEGDGNFAIWAYSPERDLLVNEIGPFTGEVLLRDGTFFFEITANGPWSITPPR